MPHPYSIHIVIQDQQGRCGDLSRPAAVVGDQGAGAGQACSGHLDGIGRAQSGGTTYPGWLVGQGHVEGQDLQVGKSSEVQFIIVQSLPISGPGRDGENLGQGDGAAQRSNLLEYLDAYGIIPPPKVENLLVAGRCVGGDKISHAATRQMMCCAVTGQGAGVAAAVSLKDGVACRQVEIGTVRKALEKQGVRIE